MAQTPDPVSVGDFARAVVSGAVTSVDPDTGVVRIGNAQIGAVLVTPADTVVREFSRVRPPEAWQTGDWILTADGQVFVRVNRDRWRTLDGLESFHDDPVRPLTLLVRGGVKQ